ncbi:hypothetical protein Q5752_001683 [Cryptotrichosporon argae]
MNAAHERPLKRARAREQAGFRSPVSLTVADLLVRDAPSAALAPTTVPPTVPISTLGSDSRLLSTSPPAPAPASRASLHNLLNGPSPDPVPDAEPSGPAGAASHQRRASLSVMPERLEPSLPSRGAGVLSDSSGLFSPPGTSRVPVSPTQAYRPAIPPPAPRPSTSMTLPVTVARHRPLQVHATQPLPPRHTYIVGPASPAPGGTPRDTSRWPPERIEGYRQGWDDAIRHVQSGGIPGAPVPLPPGFPGTVPRPYTSSWPSSSAPAASPSSHRHAYGGGFAAYSEFPPPAQYPPAPYGTSRASSSYTPSSSYPPSPYTNGGAGPSLVAAAERPARSAMSCFPCRRRKLKCDDGRPCGACRKRGESEDCTFPRAVKRRGRGKRQREAPGREDPDGDAADASDASDSGGKEGSSSAQDLSPEIVAVSAQA